MTLSCFNINLSLNGRMELRFVFLSFPFFYFILYHTHSYIIQQILTSTLEAYGSPNGHSAMALTVGMPCGIASQLVLDGVLKTPGVHAPYSKEICDPIRVILEKEGLGLVEKAL